MISMTMKTVRAAALFAAVLVAFAGLSAQAAESSLGQPKGRVLLTVSGEIGVTNEGDTARFDLDMLNTLESHSFETATIWTEGEQVFTGVTLKALLQRLKVSEGTIYARAINDYAVTIPFEDATDGSALIAYKRNGETMSVRDKGPLWIVYPYDSDPRFRAESYHARSIWQLDRIEILP